MNDATRGTGGPGDGTRAVRAGLPEPVKHEPTLPGPVFAAHFHLPGDPTGPYTYGRDENPTWTLLERAIGELRPEYRTAILLRHVEGRPYEEIAEIMGVPLGTVKTYIHRARGELRETLAHLRINT